jgi:hypothetical protein
MTHPSAVEQRLLEAEAKQELIYIDVDGLETVFLGYHPLLGRITITKRQENPSIQLPSITLKNYLASWDTAPHVCAMGDTPQEAWDALMTIVADASDQWMNTHG